MYLYLLLSLVIAASKTERSMETDSMDQYCGIRYRRLCHGKGPHVACEFPTPGPGESCHNYIKIIFDKQLQDIVTHYINSRRQRIASGSETARGGARIPQPDIMMHVEWDKELAMLAQRLADQCHFVHDDCRATVRYPYAGQTVGEVRWRRSATSDRQSIALAVQRVLDAWWGEKRKVTVRQLIQPFRLNKNQFAVWKLRAVGCAIVLHGRKHRRLLMVCDFSHTNMLGQSTLVPGKLAPCPVHTMRLHSAYPLLCVSVRLLETHIQEEDEDVNDDLSDDKVSEDDSNNSEDAAVTAEDDHDVYVDKELQQDKFNEKIGHEKPWKIKISSTVSPNDEEYYSDVEKTTYKYVENVRPKFREKGKPVKSRVMLEELDQELKTKHENHYPRTKLQKRPNIGLSRNKNTGRVTTTDATVPKLMEAQKNRYEDPGETEYKPVSHRWRPHIAHQSTDTARWRPIKRPGAKALPGVTFDHSQLVAPVKERNVTRVKLKMAKEDMEQLFKDTGFHPARVKYKFQTTADENSE